MGAFFAELVPALDATGLSYEIVCVNDGSRDRTLERLGEFGRTLPLQVVDLSRNFGKEAALTAGIEHARGRAIIPIDADLQDPPELISEMIALWREGNDVVLAQRKSRGTDTPAKRITARLFYQLINKMSPIAIPSNTGDFRLMDRKVVDALAKLDEKNRFMKGLFAWVGFRTAAIRFDRRSRVAGETKWNYWKLWNFALDGIFSFSNLPLKIWVYVGMVVSTLAFCYGIFLMLRTLFLGIDLPGYASMMVSMLFLGGVQLLSLGIVGEYVGRIYNETKQRPNYLVRSVQDFTAAEGATPRPRSRLLRPRRNTNRRNPR